MDNIYIQHLNQYILCIIYFVNITTAHKIYYTAAGVKDISLVKSIVEKINAFARRSARYTADKDLLNISIMNIDQSQ